MLLELEFQKINESDVSVLILTRKMPMMKINVEEIDECKKQKGKTVK